MDSYLSLVAKTKAFAQYAVESKSGVFFWYLLVARSAFGRSDSDFGDGSNDEAQSFGFPDKPIEKSKEPESMVTHSQNTKRNSYEGIRWLDAKNSQAVRSHGGLAPAC